MDTRVRGHDGKCIAQKLLKYFSHFFNINIYQFISDELIGNSGVEN